MAKNNSKPTITGTEIAYKSSSNNSYRQGIKDAARFLSQDGVGLAKLNQIISELDQLMLQTENKESLEPSQDNIERQIETYQ